MSKQLIFLEGGQGLSDSDEEDFISLSKKFNCMLFDNLYEEPLKIIALKYLKPEFLHISTTGMYQEKLKTLIDYFEIAEHIPEGVIFSSERTAMVLLGLARELKEKGTHFYYCYDGKLQEISWI